VRNGRFGPYVALVEEQDNAEDSKSSKASKSAKARPKMASLFKTMDPATLTLQEALQLLNLPRLVGEYEEVDAEGVVKLARIEANNGRYGPYLTKTYSAVDTSAGETVESKPDTRSLSSEDAIFTVTLQEAKDLFAQPKYGKRT
ncbi:DNA topoisomerase, partial [Bifidobacteriaceae bacterium NR015]